MADVFKTLSGVNVNDRTEERDGLTYLSWAWAWAEVKKRYPDATYTIWKDEKNLPFVYDANTGYMVYTTVTIEGITHEMWLPVLGTMNKALKAEPYNVRTRRGDMRIEAATMFDINKAIMRCLTKNLAMFGLGLYIYAKEDLPEVYDEDQTQTKELNSEKVVKTENIPADEKQNVKDLVITAEQQDEIFADIKAVYENTDERRNLYRQMMASLGVSSLSRLPASRFSEAKEFIASVARSKAV